MALLSDDWVTTFTPETARLAEQAMREGRLPQNFAYQVPREWAEANPNHGPVVWAYHVRSILTGEPFLLSGPSATEPVGIETRCPIVGVHEHAFRGPHRFQEWEPL